MTAPSRRHPLPLLSAPIWMTPKARVKRRVLTAVCALALGAVITGCGEQTDANSDGVGAASDTPANGTPSSSTPVGTEPSPQAEPPSSPPDVPPNSPPPGPLSTPPSPIGTPPSPNPMMTPPVQPPATGTGPVVDPPVGGSGGAPMTPMGGAGPTPAGGSGGGPIAAGGGGAAAGAMNSGGAPGGDLPPNPSGIAEPGEGGVARPSGPQGNLVVLPWAGFSGAISYSFDDANSTQINNEDVLLGLGVPFTWYLQTGKQEAGDAFYQRAYEAGHELGNHTQNHGSGAADQDVNSAQQFIMSTYSVVAYTMAAPNGSTNNYNDITAQMFILDRGVNDSLIGPDDNVNLLNLPSYIPPTGAGTSQMNPKVDGAVNGGGWQTVCIHGFQGGSDGAYQPIDLDGFIEHVEYAKGQDIWIGSMLDVGAYFIGRKAVADAAVAVEGDAEVYTWTLPDIFPPGQYVRVTVDGGTLSQDGVPLPWNEHGFYEVALDAGSLTLSP